jgi:hypothetical protein
MLLFYQLWHSVIWKLDTSLRWKLSVLKKIQSSRGTYRLHHEGGETQRVRKNISSNKQLTLWRMVSSGLLRRVALVRTDVSEEPGASFIRVKTIGELGTTQAATLRSVRRLLVAACVVPSSPILSPWWRRRQVPPKRRFLQEPHGVTTQKTPFFKVISWLPAALITRHPSTHKSWH